MMKTIYIAFFLFSILSFAQVGINTTSPQATLDINGDLRIQKVPTGDTSVEAIAVDSNGNVVKLPLSTSNTALIKGQLKGVSTPKDITIKASDAPAGYDKLKSVTVSIFNGGGKNSITGVLVDTGVLACNNTDGSGNGGCTVKGPGGVGTFTLDVSSDPGFVISLRDISQTYSNVYWTIEYSRD